MARHWTQFFRYSRSLLSASMLVALSTSAIADGPTATLTVPSQILEGQPLPNGGTISISDAQAGDTVFSLSTDPPGQVFVPTTVTISAGQLQQPFNLQAFQNTKIDGSRNVTITASATGFAPASTNTTVNDDEALALYLDLPASVLEGGASSGFVFLAGSIPTPLDVHLTSSDETVLTVPPVVTIPAGSSLVSFFVTGIENSQFHGQTATVTATADGFTSAQKDMLVRDNDPVAYQIRGLTDLVDLGSPVPVVINALDVSGQPILDFTGSVNLSVVFADGSSQAVAPATVDLDQNGWFGSVSVAATGPPPMRLRAVDSNGIAGLSSPFEGLRVIHQVAKDLVWDFTRNRIYASVPATAGTYANSVIVIDPATLQIVTSIATGQDPGRLALTSSGEKLYVALNGNGTIAAIDLTSQTFTTFPLGSDPNFGTLYAQDICCVVGQPNLLIVARMLPNLSPAYAGVAVYDNGVRRPVVTLPTSGVDVIEPSADPTVYFGYNNENSEYGFRRLQLGATGMTELSVDTNLLNGGVDLRSDGDKVFATSGFAVNGKLGVRLGSFQTFGLVRPDLAGNRVYFLDSQFAQYGNYDTISAYDPESFTALRRLTIPTGTSGRGLIRWGGNGLAFCSADSIVLIDNSSLVPSAPPADLAVQVSATPNPLTTVGTLTFVVAVSNQGPNTAPGASLDVVLSGGQTVQSVTASQGTAMISGNRINLPIGDLAAGGAMTLSIATLPNAAGTISCTGMAVSRAIESDLTNNVATQLVNVGFTASPNFIQSIQLPANNLVFDSVRRLLWVSIPDTVAPPLGKSVVAIDPLTGAVSQPIPLQASPTPRCMALSQNGQYLYVGAIDLPEMVRLDLTATPVEVATVPLSNNLWGEYGFASDVEVLEGDGTSFVIVSGRDASAVVYDGPVPRPNRTAAYTVGQLVRTVTQGTYLGYLQQLTRLPVTASGVSISQSNSSLLFGYGTTLASDGNTVLSGNGQLFDGSTWTLRANLGSTVGYGNGTPGADELNHHVFLIYGAEMSAFSSLNGAFLANFSLPPDGQSNWVTNFVRWGLDGFAFLGAGKLYIGRWSQIIGPGLDLNGNGIADDWEASYLGPYGARPGADSDSDGIRDQFEYMFGSSPVVPNSNPCQTFQTSDAGQTKLHFVFPRRVGLVAGAYAFEVSEDLVTWSPAQALAEDILSTQVIDGVQVQMVDASMLSPSTSRGFVRLKWMLPSP